MRFFSHPLQVLPPRRAPGQSGYPQHQARAAHRHQQAVNVETVHAAKAQQRRGEAAHHAAQDTQDHIA